jgi:ribose/xylose/arabinose/galactoside ABC-type transport system permease subunit
VATRSPVTDSRSTTVKLNRLVNVYVLFALICVASVVFLPPFRSWSNATSLLSTSSPLIMAALGQLFAMIVWGVDLSIGSNMNVVIAFGSYTLDAPLGMAAAGVVACVLLGGLLGLVNGLLITRLRLPDFVVTLGTFITFQGVALTLRPTPGGAVNPDLLALAYDSTFSIPNTTLALIPILAALAYGLRSTQWGHYMIAVGSNRDSSYLVGLPVDRIRVCAYTVAGLCAGAAGVFLLGLIGTGPADAATPYQLDSIIATVVGGTSLYGGRGTVLGTVCGALILQVVLKALTYANLIGSSNLIFEGAMVILVVTLVSWSEGKRMARRQVRPAKTA